MLFTVACKAYLKMTGKRGNDDELLAQHWLRAQGYEDIQRPCSDPPDFIADGKFAVEVTRLNKRILVGADQHSKGEEQIWKPLRDQIKRTIEQLGSPGNEGRSWIINCEYDPSIPLPDRKTVSDQISDALSPLLKPYDDNVVTDMHSRHLDFDKHADEIPCMGVPHLCLKCGICLELSEFSHEPARFLLQDVSDREGTGVAQELGKSIRNRICTKSDTIRSQNRIKTYGSWWLILVDHVCMVPMQYLSEDELSFVRDQDFDFWDRVVVVSNHMGGWHYDLRPW